MTPVDAARGVYDREPCRRLFEEDLALHLQLGFVFSTPTYFAMGRPVFSCANHAEIVDPSVVFAPELCDCWHVFLMAGDMAKAFEIVPWPLPWLSLERRNRLRIYRANSIKRLANRLPWTSQSTSFGTKAAAVAEERR